MELDKHLEYKVELSHLMIQSLDCMLVQLFSLSFQNVRVDPQGTYSDETIDMVFLGRLIVAIRER